MNFTELKQSLKAKVESCYLLHGEDVFLMNKAIEMIKEAAKETDVIVFNEDTTKDQVITARSTISMFGGERVAIVRNAPLALMKELKGATAVNCGFLEPAIIVKLIERSISELGKKITPIAATLLAKSAGHDYGAVDNELKKLVNFFWDKDTLDVEHVNEVVTKTVDYQLWELGNVINKGDLKLASQMLETLRGSNEDYAIFGSLISMYRRIYYAVNTNAEPAKVAALFKCNPFAITAARRDNKSSAAKMTEKYKKILNLEHDIKSGRLSVESGINLVLMG